MEAEKFVRRTIDDAAQAVHFELNDFWGMLPQWWIVSGRFFECSDPARRAGVVLAAMSFQATCTLGYHQVASLAKIHKNRRKSNPSRWNHSHIYRAIKELVRKELVERQPGGGGKSSEYRIVLEPPRSVYGQLFSQQSPGALPRQSPGALPRQSPPPRTLYEEKIEDHHHQNSDDDDLFLDRRAVLLGAGLGPELADELADLNGCRLPASEYKRLAGIYLQQKRIRSIGAWWRKALDKPHLYGPDPAKQRVAEHRASNRSLVLSTAEVKKYEEWAAGDDPKRADYARNVLRRAKGGSSCTD